MSGNEVDIGDIIGGLDPEETGSLETDEVIDGNIETDEVIDGNIELDSELNGNLETDSVLNGIQV